jgi:hypothetical protein
MHRFYYVTFGLMIIGLLILCVYAPWTQPESGSNLHTTIGYAPIWSKAYAQIPAAHVDWGGAFATYAAGIVFFSIVLGAITYFFREKRGKPATHRMKLS